MTNKTISLSIFLFLFYVHAVNTNAQQTVGLFEKDSSSFEGYTLFAPIQGTTAYLIDHYGRLVNTWESGGVTLFASVYLLENGNLLWTASVSSSVGGSHVIEFDWDGNIVWEWEDNSLAYLQHHDIARMPNGNVLILARDFKTATEAFAAGRDTLDLFADSIWSEMVIEVQPTGPSSRIVVWEWYAWDHLIQDFDSTRNNFGVVEDHPELMDINVSTGAPDWIHSNAINYNPDLDQIVISHRTISEFWVIDHSTSTAEAASHSGGNNGIGGDLIYRWGNALNYRAGDSSDQAISFQHDVQWIPPGNPGAGNILIFNNGNKWGVSSIVEIETSVQPNGLYPLLSPGEAHGPTAPIWTYTDTPPESFYAWFISGCQRLPNGNTLICHGPTAEFREVNTNGDIVWKYRSPISTTGPIAQGDSSSVGIVFRCYRYGVDYPGFTGKDLTPSSALEIYPVEIRSTSHAPANPTELDSLIAITAGIQADFGIVASNVMIDTGTGFNAIELFDDGMHQDGLSGDGIFGATIGGISAGTTVSYYINVVDGIDSVVNDPPNPISTVYTFTVKSACCDLAGDVNNSSILDVTDLTDLVQYFFVTPGTPVPGCFSEADVNASCVLDVTDLTDLVQYFFVTPGIPVPVCGCVP